MSGDLKLPLIHAALVGCAAVGLYYTVYYFTSDGNSSSVDSIEYKEITTKNLFDQLKKDLRKTSFNPEREAETGILSSEFLMKLHTLLY